MGNSVTIKFAPREFVHVTLGEYVRRREPGAPVSSVCGEFECTRGCHGDTGNWGGWSAVCWAARSRKRARPSLPCNETVTPYRTEGGAGGVADGRGAGVGGADKGVRGGVSEGRRGPS